MPVLHHEKGRRHAHNEAATAPPTWTTTAEPQVPVVMSCTWLVSFRPTPEGSTTQASKTKRQIRAKANPRGDDAFKKIGQWKWCMSKWGPGLISLQLSIEMFAKADCAKLCLDKGKISRCLGYASVCMAAAGDKRKKASIQPTHYNQIKAWSQL